MGNSRKLSRKARRCQDFFGEKCAFPVVFLRKWSFHFHTFAHTSLTFARQRRCSATSGGSVERPRCSAPRAGWLAEPLARRLVATRRRPKACAIDLRRSLNSSSTSSWQELLDGASRSASAALSDQQSRVAQRARVRAGLMEGDRTTRSTVPVSHPSGRDMCVCPSPVAWSAREMAIAGPLAGVSCDRESSHAYVR